jgi:hypothetical protein
MPFAKALRPMRRDGTVPAKGMDVRVIQTATKPTCTASDTPRAADERRGQASVMRLSSTSLPLNGLRTGIAAAEGEKADCRADRGNTHPVPFK